MTQTDPVVDSRPGADPRDLSAPFRHRFPTVVIHLTILWFVLLHLSCRGVRGVWVSLELLLGLPAPGHQTVCTWVLRVGLFLLQRRHPRYNDWVFVLDSTLQLGNRKCLVILGARLSVLATLERAPRTSDFTVLDLEVTDHCNGDFVKKRIDTVCERVGEPRQLVSDHSGEFTRGLRLVQKDHSTVVATYDITHKMCLLVEAELTADDRWVEFLKKCSVCSPRMQQTAGAFLMPPSLRTMARYMHVADHVDWAQKVLGVLDRQDVEVLAKDLKVSEAEALEWLEERLGWVREYRQELKEYGQLLELSKQVQAEVKNNGLSRQTPEEIEKAFAAEVAGGRWQQWWDRLMTYLKAEAEQVPQGEKWLGSSDVIESLFGRYKQASGQAPFPEIGANVLLLPVLTTELSGDLVRTALETVSCQQVQEWVDEHLGESTLAKIRRVLRTPHKPAAPTQNQHELAPSAA